MYNLLSDLSIVEVSSFVASPTAGLYCAQMGAEVIRVDHKAGGLDYNRYMLTAEGRSLSWENLNRAKKSVALDLQSPEGRELLVELAAKVGQCITNLPEQSFLSHAAMAAKRADMISLRVMGWHDGRQAMDFTVNAAAGYPLMTGPEDWDPATAPPVNQVLPAWDFITGAYGAFAMLAALRHRDRTGEGQRIDLALLDAQVAMMSNQAANWLNGGPEPRRLGNQHPNIVPYQVFACADGDILIATANDRQYRKLCRVIGRDELADDPRFAAMSARGTNRAALLAEIEPVIGAWPSDDLVTALNDAGVPSGRVNTVPEALDHPQVRARELVGELERQDGSEVRFVGFPAKLSASPASYRTAPPRAGEDGAEVLGEILDLEHDEIVRLQGLGIVG